MKTSSWIPNNTIKAREELEYMLEKEDSRVKGKNSIKIDLRQIDPSSIFSSFLALFRKKSS